MPAAEFDREWEIVLDRVKQSRDLADLHELLNKWRHTAYMELRDPGSYDGVASYQQPPALGVLGVVVLGLGEGDPRPVVVALSFGACPGAEPLPGPFRQRGADLVGAHQAGSGGDSVVAADGQHVSDAVGFPLATQGGVGAVDFVTGYPAWRDTGVQRPGAARLSRCCMLRGSLSPACSAIVQQFLPGRSASSPSRNPGHAGGSRPTRTGRPSVRASCRSRSANGQVLRSDPRPPLDHPKSTQPTMIAVAVLKSRTATPRDHELRLVY